MDIYDVFEFTMTNGERSCDFLVHAKNPFMVNAQNNLEFKRAIQHCEVILTHPAL